MRKNCRRRGLTRPQNLDAFVILKKKKQKRVINCRVLSTPNMIERQKPLPSDVIFCHLHIYSSCLVQAVIFKLKNAGLPGEFVFATRSTNFRFEEVFITSKNVTFN